MLGLSLNLVTAAIRGRRGPAGPSLDLNFLSGTVDPRITVTRASAATRVNQQGLIETVGPNVPRIDYDPVTLQPRGLLVEEQRSNELLQSDTLSTQSVTVTAATRTLSFYGTGTVALSGAHTATVVGSAAYPTRTTLTFTPTAGTLTLTVTGSVRFAQLEVGAFATSYIPTTTAQATRAADNAVMTGANFSSWFNAAQGTLYAEGLVSQTAGNDAVVAELSDGTNPNRMTIFKVANGANAVAFVNNGNSGQAFLTVSNVFNAGQVGRVALVYAQDFFQLAGNGVVGVADTAGFVPPANRLLLGGTAAPGNPMFNGHIRAIRFYPRAMSASELQALTA